MILELGKEGTMCSRQSCSLTLLSSIMYQATSGTQGYMADG